MNDYYAELLIEVLSNIRESLITIADIMCDEQTGDSLLENLSVIASSLKHSSDLEEDRMVKNGGRDE